MRTRIDLGAAAVRLAARQTRWVADGLVVAPTQWNSRTGWGEDADLRAERLLAEVTAPDWEVVLLVQLDRAGRAYVGFASERDQTWGRGRRIRSMDGWDALLDQAVRRAVGTRVQHGQLVARTCTTGWRDPVHGELWVMPDCLVRIRTGLPTTLVQAFGSRTSARRAGHTLAYDPAAVLAAHRTNRVIPLRDIAHARMRRGYAAHGISLQMADGTRHKLLWQSSDPARRLLIDRLLPLLGPRLRT